MSDSSASASTPQQQLKRRRITRACDKCHRGGIKCAPGPNPRACGPCASFGTECTYDRPAKRRGPPAKVAKLVQGGAAGTGSAPRPPVRRVGPHLSEGGTPWSAINVAPHSVVEYLVDAFYHICYPLYVNHWGQLACRVKEHELTVQVSFLSLADLHVRCTAETLSRGPPFLCDSHGDVRYQRSSYTRRSQNAKYAITGSRYSAFRSILRRSMPGLSHFVDPGSGLQLQACFILAVYALYSVWLGPRGQVSSVQPAPDESLGQFPQRVEVARWPQSD